MAAFARLATNHYAGLTRTAKAGAVTLVAIAIILVGFPVLGWIGNIGTLMSGKRRYTFS